MNASKINSDLQIGFEKNHMISNHHFVHKTIREQARMCNKTSTWPLLIFSRRTTALTALPFSENCLPTRYRLGLSAS